MCRVRTDANVEFTVVIKYENLWKFTEEACAMKIKLNSTLSAWSLQFWTYLNF